MRSKQRYQIRSPDCSQATLARALIFRVPSSDSDPPVAELADQPASMSEYIIAFSPSVAAHKLLFNLAVSQRVVENDKF